MYDSFQSGILSKSWTKVIRYQLVFSFNVTNRIFRESAVSNLVSTAFYVVKNKLLPSSHSDDSTGDVPTGQASVADLEDEDIDVLMSSALLITATSVEFAIKRVSYSNELLTFFHGQRYGKLSLYMNKLWLAC